MKPRKKAITILFLIFIMVGLMGPHVPVVRAESAQFGTHTTVYLTARVQNKWWYAGNLTCTAATLETLGFTYEGEIQEGHWWGLAGNESCLIIFRNVPYPLGVTPADVTVSFYTTVADEFIDYFTEDRLQTQVESYFLEFAWYDDYVILDDMILQDTSTVPVINYDPTALPDLPDVPGAPAP